MNCQPINACIIGDRSRIKLAAFRHMILTCLSDDLLELPTISSLLIHTSWGGRPLHTPIPLDFACCQPNIFRLAMPLSWWVVILDHNTYWVETENDKYPEAQPVVQRFWSDSAVLTISRYFIFTTVHMARFIEDAFQFWRTCLYPELVNVNNGALWLLETLRS